MNTETPHPPPAPPHARRQPRRGRSLLVAILAFALTVALFYAEENWRGKRAWENYKRTAEAKSRVIDWPAYIPPAVPDDQNIFKAPRMQEWFVKPSGARSTQNEFSNVYDTLSARLTNRIAVAEITICEAATASVTTNALPVFSFDDPAARQQALAIIEAAVGPRVLGAQGFNFVRAPLNSIRPARICFRSEKKLTASDIANELPGLAVRPGGSNQFAVTIDGPIPAAEYLARTEPLETDFEIMRAGLKRPYARVDDDFKHPLEIPIQNFMMIRHVAQILAQRAQAFLLRHEPEKALNELTFLHQLGRLLEKPGGGKPVTFVAAMIDVALKRLYVSTVKDGLRLGVWREAELAAIQAQLQEVDLLPLVAGSLEMEVAAVCHAFETTPLIELQKSWASSGLSTHGPRVSVFDLLPHGWVYQNMTKYARLMDLQIESFNISTRTVLPRNNDKAAASINNAVSHASPFNLIARIAIPNALKAAQTMARVQSSANQAQIVCAVERYRLAHREYPQSLEQLVPQYLAKIPRDPIEGTAPHYRRTSDGKFVLYSIGWSEKDHGGATSSDVKQGDWVWSTELNQS